MYRMIFEVLRFNQEASQLALEADLLEFQENGEPKQGENLIQGKFGIFINIVSHSK